MNLVIKMFLIVVLVAPFAQVVAAEELPSEAMSVVMEFDKAAGAIRQKAETSIEPFRKKAVKRLKALQDKYCRAAKLNEALAIRQAIRQLKGIHPDPGLLRAKPEQIGRVFLYEVTGNPAGSVWGTEVYTSDSHLATAAVHSGILEPGQKGIVKVRILRGQKSYQASTAHGVTSRAWGAWNVSFTIERYKD
ncbi:MAG: hypothetical protein JRJ87_14950 [Deltaproteobacteria bacterium]|nr:hypothetical protein [Deltaproteobacteria bacterium]